MDVVMKSDIFFFITTICVVVLSLGGVVLLLYVINIARDIRKIVGRVRIEGEELMSDLKEARVLVKERGLSFINIIASFFGMRQKRKK